MADSARQAKRASEAPDHANSRTAPTRTPAPSGPQATPISSATPRAMLARRLGAVAGNAAAVRAVRRDPAETPAASAPAPVAEQEPAQEPPQPAAEGEQAGGEAAQVLGAVLPSIASDVQRERSLAQAAVQQFGARADALVQAATPMQFVNEVPADRLQAAHEQFQPFATALVTGRAELEVLLGRGDRAYRRAGPVQGAMGSEEAMRGWIEAAADAAGQYHGIQEALPDAWKQMVDAGLGFARIGKDLEQPDYVQAVLAATDEVQKAGKVEVPERPDLSRVKSAPTWNDRFASVFGLGDVLNNSGAVVTSAIGLAVTAGAAATAGTVSAYVGLAFAGIGTALALRASFSAHSDTKKLAKAREYLSSDKAKDVATYAKQQKATKRNRQAALALLGAGTIAVGVAGLATGGLGLVIAGIVVALAGLGVVIGKAIHSHRKRAAEAKAAADMAAALEVEAQEGKPESVRIVHEVNHGNHDELVEWCATQEKNKRHNTAVQIVKMVGSEVPSERFNGETIVEALGVAPAAITTALDENEPDKAVGLVERKLASW